jgi:hypothetical protein
VIPLLFLLGALAAFLLWRRRKQKKAAVAATSKDFADGHETKRSYEEVPQEPFSNSNIGIKSASGTAVGATAVAAAASTGRTGTHETPEWNAELDATEAERRKYLAVQGSLFPPNSAPVDASSQGGESEVSELGGMMRVNRKPVAPVELDSIPVTSELDSGGNVERI